MSTFPSAPSPAPVRRDEPRAVSRAPLLALVAAILVALATIFVSGCGRPTPEARAREAHAAQAFPALAAAGDVIDRWVNVGTEVQPGAALCGWCGPAACGRTIAASRSASQRRM